MGLGLRLGLGLGLGLGFDICGVIVTGLGLMSSRTGSACSSKLVS